MLEDNQTKIYYWKQFYPNGKLKEEEAMTKDEILYIGFTLTIEIITRTTGNNA